MFVEESVSLVISVHPISRINKAWIWQYRQWHNMRVIPVHPFKQKFVINNLIQEKVLPNHFFESKPDEVKFKTEEKSRKHLK